MQRTKRFLHPLCVIEPEGKGAAHAVHQKRIRGLGKIKSHPLRLRHGDDYVKTGSWHFHPLQHGLLLLGICRACSKGREYSTDIGA